MTISDSLYTYGINEKKLNKIKKKLLAHKRINNLYIVTLPITGDGIMEIYVYNQLLQPFYEPALKDINVLGMAKNKSDAEELVLRMIQDMYDAGAGDSLDMEYFVREA